MVYEDESLGNGGVGGHDGDVGSGLAESNLCGDGRLTGLSGDLRDGFSEMEGSRSVGGSSLRGTSLRSWTDGFKCGLGKGKISIRGGGESMSRPGYGILDNWGG